ncbi:MAG: HU family DNA-binding protein [Methylococcales bacterium]|nr:HU family DNA-binding protein [Methylococcales bacterium]
MNKSDLIDAIAKKQTHLTLKVVDLAVDCIIEGLCQAAIANERIEIRGFGAFTLHHYPARLGRNPKNGEFLNLSAKYGLHFKPGKQLRDRVNVTRLTCPLEKES